MSPTECFKNHNIPFRRGEKKNTQKKGKRKYVDVVESLDLPSHPHEQPAHPGAPRLGATATTASWSPFSMEMKTPWWWATSVHGVGVWMSTAKRPLQLLAPGKSGRTSPAPGPWPQSNSREAPSQALPYQSNQVYIV